MDCLFTSLSRDKSTTWARCWDALSRREMAEPVVLMNPHSASHETACITLNVLRRRRGEAAKTSSEEIATGVTRGVILFRQEFTARQPKPTDFDLTPPKLNAQIIQQNAKTLNV